MFARFYKRLHAHCSRFFMKPVSLCQRDGDKLSRNQIGDLGERIACSYLRSQACKVLYRNYRGPRGGEIDVVVRHQNTLIFVEVKTRTYRGYGRPLDAVDKDKQELIERGANSWLNLLTSRDILWRFDVIEIILSDGETPEITWVKDAF
ncbi:MAG: YraN family protein [Akkermansiaceae bacterium]